MNITDPKKFGVVWYERQALFVGYTWHLCRLTHHVIDHGKTLCVRADIMARLELMLDGIRSIPYLQQPDNSMNIRTQTRLTISISNVQKIFERNIKPVGAFRKHDFNHYSNGLSWYISQTSS